MVSITSARGLSVVEYHGGHDDITVVLELACLPTAILTG